MSVARRWRTDPLLEGGDDAARLIRAKDWSGHALGGPETWPAELRGALSLVLNASDAMILAWGPDLCVFFNGAYLPLLGPRADSAMGAPLDEVWADSIDQMRPMIDDALAGRHRRAVNMFGKHHTAAGSADAWWTFSYSRVPDADGALAGLFILATETTQAVIDAAAVRAGIDRQAFLLELDQALRDLSEPAGILKLMVSRIGHHLGIQQVSYADVDRDGQFATCEHEYNEGSIPSCQGKHRIDEFGKGIATDLRTGTTVVIPDVADDPRTNADQSLGIFKQLSVVAFASFPVHRDGRLRAGLTFCSDHKRQWSEQEIALGRWAAQRAWAAVERARAIKSLAASEATFRTLAQGMPNHVWTATATGGANWFNDRCYDYSGAPHGELDGKGWTSFVHPDDLAAAAEAWRRSLESGSDYEIEWRLLGLDGTYRWHITRATPISGDQGAIISWIGTNTDIEDQKRATAELEQLNQRLEQEVASQSAARDQMWRNSRDLLVIFGMDKIVRAISPSVEHIVGWLPEEVVGRSIYDFIVPDDHAQADEGLELLSRGFERVVVNRWRHKGGGFRWLSWVINPPAGLIYATGRHITAEKEAAATLAATQEALRQSQKMEALGQLTGGIAHDFNNLLTPILGSIDLARRELGDDPRIARVMAAGAQAADRARSLVGRLLAFSRRQTLDPQSVDLTHLLIDMADLIRRSIGPDIEVRFDLPETLPYVCVDANQLEMSILNISLNARDAMPAGGTLVFAARVTSAAERHVELSITDTGSGMDAETAARATEPFFTTKSEGKGTGLGLSMVHGLMAQLGGSMDVQSALGRGTTIVLRMPVAAMGVVPPAPCAPESTDKEPQPDGREVLVVDDEALVLTMTADMLDEEGYHVTEAASAEEALKLIDSGYAPDVLVTDQSMPGMKGNQLATAFIDRMGPRPVLIATGYSTTRDFGFPTISKPFTAPELARKIRELQRTAG